MIPPQARKGTPVRFRGPVAIATGVASGLGRLSAQREATEGATVVLGDIDGNAVTAVAADIRAEDGEAIGDR